TASIELYTLSLHDALPIYGRHICGARLGSLMGMAGQAALLDEEKASVLGVLGICLVSLGGEIFELRDLAELDALLQIVELILVRSEEHTSELQSLAYLVCR